MFRIKSERAEQFTKRMSKEDRLNKAEKEHKKDKLMQARDLFEGQNLGGYRRVYPSENQVILKL